MPWSNVERLGARCGPLRPAAFGRRGVRWGSIRAMSVADAQRYTGSPLARRAPAPKKSGPVLPVAPRAGLLRQPSPSVQRTAGRPPSGPAFPAARRFASAPAGGLAESIGCRHACASNRPPSRTLQKARREVGVEASAGGRTSGGSVSSPLSSGWTYQLPGGATSTVAGSPPRGWRQGPTTRSPPEPGGGENAAHASATPRTGPIRPT